MKKMLPFAALALGMMLEVTGFAQLSVYPPVPGLAPSPHYSFRVRAVSTNQWLTPFAWLTKCVEDVPGVANKYYSEAFGGWTHTYCNFEMGSNALIEVEITRLNPTNGNPVAIQKAVPHPRRKVRSWRVENGKAYVIFDKPVLFAVDIDGQMDEHDAPKDADGNYPYRNENAFHTVSVFANPFILDKPSTNGPGVYVVPPGSPNLPPDNGPWTTLYFAPGVHKLFPEAMWTNGSLTHDYQLRSNKKYYIPGDAIVYGNFNNYLSGEDTNIRFFGHGTLSGAKTLHSQDMTPPATEGKRLRLLIINGGKHAIIEGITMADPPAHTCKIEAGWNTNPAEFNYVKWAKVFSWRANGDGITVKGSSYLEDSFIRHQDDGSYVRGLGIRRVVYWTDVNGAPLRGSFIGRERNNFPAGMPAGLDKMYVEDIDVIYGRRRFADADFRAVLSSGGWGGSYSSYLTFRNINYEDPRPQRKLFAFKTRGGTGGEEMSGITFQNVRAAARTIYTNLQDSFLGDAKTPIKNLVFDNCVLAGKHYDSLSDFQTSGASGWVFSNTAPQTMTFQNTSGYGKWYVYGDWSSGVEPANNDTVNHTAVAVVLTVDAPAYAGTLNIGHAGTATVAIELGGNLKVKNSVSLGATGTGELKLLDGSLDLQSTSNRALSVATGSIQIGKGMLVWNGNHISDIQSLYAAGKITLTGGRTNQLSGSATLIGQVGPNQLYADYNNGNNGYTRAWVKTSP